MSAEERDLRTTGIKKKYYSCSDILVMK